MDNSPSTVTCSLSAFLRKCFIRVEQQELKRLNHRIAKCKNKNSEYPILFMKVFLYLLSGGMQNLNKKFAKCYSIAK